MRYISLGLVLFAFWLALSGHYTPFLIAVGAGCVLVVMMMARRMGIVDAEGHPVAMLPRTISYFPWLAWEIIKSAVTVSRIILSPRLPISPTMTVVKAKQSTPAGIATFANSITLTPGTLTTHVDGHNVTIHALTRDGANDIQSGTMNARVKRFEGRS